MAAKFGTSGLRGLASELVGETSYRYASAFVRHLVETSAAKLGAPVFLGWDFRASSIAIASNVASAIKAQGLTPVACGPIPTPALAFYAMSNSAASIMITGSHIPADRNGLKFYLPSGEISKPDELRISELAAAHAGHPPAAGTLEASFGPVDAEAAALFRRRMTALTRSSPLAGMSIGVYQHSTVARDMLGEILSEAGASWVALGRSESFIPIDTEALPPDADAALKGWCKDHQLDAIISADGDGDRPLIVDAQGSAIRGDIIGALTARFLGAEHVATPVTSNSGIDGACGARVLRTRVGSPYVIEAMAKALDEGSQRVVGFEANGGFLTASPFIYDGATIEPLPTRDCFLPIMAVLIMARREKRSLAQMVQNYDLPVALADRLENFAVERSTSIMKHLRSSHSAIRNFMAYAGEVQSIDNLDGLRMTFNGDEIVHFRPSGNAPEFRCYIEAKSKLRAEVLLAKSLASVSRWADQE